MHGRRGASADVRAAVAAASRFAELDPYRAATHNKGIMNGVDAVLVATGQDWRAVEAGAHAFARSRALSPARDLARSTAARSHGELVMPLAVGTVGGALHVHPGARLALELAGVDDRRPARRARRAPPASPRTSPRCARSRPRASSAATWRCTRASLARAAGATGELVDRVAAALSACGDVKAERAREVFAQMKPGAAGARKLST